MTVALGLRAVRRWWLRPDRYAWFSVYLDDRGLQPLVRLAAAGGTILFGAVAAAMWFSPSGPLTPGQRGTTIAVVAGAVLLTAFWVTGWPTRRRSRLFFVGGNVLIAAACLAQSDPVAGLTGCYTFVVLGGYAALMHCAKSTTLNVVVATAVATTLAVRAAQRTGDAMLPGCELAVLVALSIGVPLGLNAMLEVMARDIVRSDRDALTGLLNRRGFHREVDRLLARHPVAGGRIGITMVDLDDFKGLNDRRGHAAGDAALVEVSRTLRTHAGPSAVVARVGGEEFLVADVYPDDDALPGDALRRGVAALAAGVTASVGSASAVLDEHRTRAVIGELIASADRAMYAAKRAGGNRHRHHGDEPSARPEAVGA